ncbi:MAG: hypothetical protein V1844_08145 [Pseudomonadota bacterium]
MKRSRRSSHHGIKGSGGLRPLKSPEPSTAPKQFRAGLKQRSCQSMMKWMLAVVAAALLIGCGSPRQDEKLPSSSEEYQAGETVYVCGCPMMCCNSISRNPEGRCICNMPLRKGTVSKIQNHIIIVTVFGREKVIFLKNR